MILTRVWFLYSSLELICFQTLCLGQLCRQQRLNNYAPATAEEHPSGISQFSKLYVLRKNLKDTKASIWWKNMIGRVSLNIYLFLKAHKFLQGTLGQLFASWGM